MAQGIKLKPFYVTTSDNQYFSKGDKLLFSTTSSLEMIVLKVNCKDRLWRKILRFFGFKIFNPEGYMKVKFQEKQTPKMKSWGGWLV